MWCVHTMEYYTANKEEWNTDKSYSVGKLWKKPVTNDHILHDFIYAKCPKYENV